MTRDDILRMAREAKLPDPMVFYASIERFAALALEQPQVEQEPVAWIEHEWSGSGLRHLHFERPAPTVRDEVVCPVWTPLYTHPQPPRQPLTEDGIKQAFLAAGLFEAGDELAGYEVDIARAIEAAHGIGGEK